MWSAGAHTQDWKTVLLTPKKNVGPSEAQRKAAACTNAAVSSVTGSVAYKIEQAADGEGEKIPHVSQEDRQKIIGGRVAKKWKQADLARMCNLDVKVISEIESGKAFENKAVLSKIKRILGVQ